MLNFTVRKLALQKNLDMMPFSNLRMNSFTMDKSRFSYFANSFQFKSLSTKVSDTLFSYSLHSAIKIDGNLFNNATSFNTQQIYQQFSAFNCYFLHCKNNISGGAFTSNGRDAIVHFERCFFENCISEKEAGAIYIKDGSLHLIDSTFKGCLAYASAQAIYISSYPRNSIRLQRTSIDRCPVIAPDLQGSVVHSISGEQTVVETNVTHSKIVSGSGSIKSIKPYSFDGRYCCISFNHGTSALAIFHNTTIEGPIILDYYNIINNTLEGDDLIQTDSLIYLRNSVIADNMVIVEVTSYTPAPTKKLSKLSMVSSKKKKEEKTVAPTPTKSIFIRLEHCGLDANHAELLKNTDVCSGCNKIEGKYTLYQIPAAKTPGIRKATALPPPKEYSPQILMLCPFMTILIILIGLVMRTTNCQSTDDYVQDEFVQSN